MASETKTKAMRFKEELWVARQYMTIIRPWHLQG